MDKKFIYKIISPSNKIYIGQTGNISKRKYTYSKANCKGQTKLYNSIIKYGWVQHKFEIIEEIEHDTHCFEICNACEIYWIKFYDCINIGLNIHVGGRISGSPMGWFDRLSEDKKNIIRKRVSDRQKGNTNTKGRKQSDEAKKKIGIASLGRKNWLGKKQSELHKIRISESNLGKKKNKIKKPILQYSKEKFFIKEWIGGILEASEYLNIPYSSISSCLKKNTNAKTGYGFIWKYK